jgi:hypothetical protein
VLTRLIVFESASDERSRRRLSGTAFLEDRTEAVTAIDSKNGKQRSNWIDESPYDSNISANHVGAPLLFSNPLAHAVAAQAGPGA